MSCEKCGKALVPIRWGYPSGRINGESVFDVADRGEILIGGCCVSDKDPTHGCPDCWRKMVQCRICYAYHHPDGDVVYPYGEIPVCAGVCEQKYHDMQ